MSVEFPFSDFQGQKRRPGLILATDDQDVLLARLTTRPARDASDVGLKHWAGVGLPRASTVRLTKLVAIDARLVHHKIGQLLAEDADAVAQAVQQMAATIASALRK